MTLQRAQNHLGHINKYIYAKIIIASYNRNISNRGARRSTVISRALCLRLAAVAELPRGPLFDIDDAHPDIKFHSNLHPRMVNSVCAVINLSIYHTT